MAVIAARMLKQHLLFSCFPLMRSCLFATLICLN